MKTPSRGPLRINGPVHLWFERHPRAYSALEAVLFPVAWVWYWSRNHPLSKNGRAARAFRKRWAESLTPEERKELGVR